MSLFDPKFHSDSNLTKHKQNQRLLPVVFVRFEVKTCTLKFDMMK